MTQHLILQYPFECIVVFTPANSIRWNTFGNSYSAALYALAATSGSFRNAPHPIISIPSSSARIRLTARLALVFVFFMDDDPHAGLCILQNSLHVLFIDCDTAAGEDLRPLAVQEDG